MFLPILKRRLVPCLWRETRQIGFVTMRRAERLRGTHLCHHKRKFQSEIYTGFRFEGEPSCCVRHVLSFDRDFRHARRGPNLARLLP
jgi:hypothetical protein